MLRQLGPSKTKSIPITEHLCTLLRDTVFLGLRPITGFLRINKRFLGAKVDHIKARAGRRGKNWKVKLEMPRAIMECTGEGRLQADKLSLFHALHANSYEADVNWWVQILTNLKVKTVKGRQALRFQSVVEDKHIAHVLADVQIVIEQEFHGAFPVAQVNFFQVYCFTNEMPEDIE